MTTSARFTGSELQRALPGTTWLGWPLETKLSFEPYTDSRQEINLGLFVPLVGERFDGHDFLPQVVNSGTTAVLVQRGWWEAQECATQELLTRKSAVGLVEDTLDAYMALGRFHRKRSIKTQVIALTGSSGKTTVKNLLLHCLSQAGPTQATEKNYNNDIGVTLTLLSLKPETRWLIVEMGMRGLGEIKRLALHAEPDIGLVINVGPAHIGRLGSLETIAKAKCELLENLRRLGTLGLYNGDDALLSARAEQVNAAEKPLSYSESDVTLLPEDEAGHSRFELEGLTFRVPLPGKHQLSNVLAVLAIWRYNELPLKLLKTALESFVPSDNRWDCRSVTNRPHWTLVNDSYNANPASMKAALQAFFSRQAPQGKALKRLLILGGMEELGDQSDTYHAELADWLASRHPESWLAVIWVGESAKIAYNTLQTKHPELPQHWVETAEEVKALIEPKLAELPDSVALDVFLKGSRKQALETCLPWLSEPNSAAPV